MAHLTQTRTSWYRSHLFVTQASPTMLNAERAVIRTLTWKPSAKIHIGGCMLCCLRPIDRIALPKGDTYLLERLGLKQLGNIRNRQLAEQLRDMP